MLNPLKLDPTRTTTLRRQLAAEFSRRWQIVKRKLRELVVVEDAFALRPPENPWPATLNRRWRLNTDAEKLAAFEGWLATEIEVSITGVSQREMADAYWAAYVEEGYRKGAGRAFDDTRQAARAAAATTPESMAFYAGTKEEFLHAAFGSPVTVDKVKLLVTRTLKEIKNVGEAVTTKLVRELADGLVQGQNPHTIARHMAQTIDDIGKRRSVLIARTEIVRAHAEGQLDAFERLGVEELGVMAEWSTAGDERVCPLCASLEGVVLTVEEAKGLIPRHPQCRCAWLPSNVGEKTTGQRRSREEIRRAIKKSLEGELPKGRLIKGQEGRRYKDPETGRFTLKVRPPLSDRKIRSRWGGG